MRKNVPIVYLEQDEGGDFLTPAQAERFLSCADAATSLAKTTARVENITHMTQEVVGLHQQSLASLQSGATHLQKNVTQSVANILEGCHILGVTNVHAQSVLHGELDIYQQKKEAKVAGRTYYIA